MQQTIINHKFKVDDVFYVSRVYEETCQQTFIDNDGVEWHRNVHELKPIVKAKRVRSIEIVLRFDHTIRIQYLAMDVSDGDTSLFRIYTEDEMYESEEEAWAVANEKLKLGKPYFGGE